MRTTLTLDDDVAARIKQRVLKEKRTLKEIINQALRRGLDELEEPLHKGGYKTPSVSLGRCFLGNVDDITEVLEVAEGDDFRP